ncbi:glycosyltransferase [Persicobacter psychrovividus]|uniref:Glycosyl transferase n=1 Tax=Persicobacter psychrovividus TaxID=387638 RepID=A0ABM7VCX1_9BACT|nr:glycosyl transferase [Persicobacter psychrovividus]
MNKKTENTSPLVTVAMVTYNSSLYVRQAIESVLANKYANIELIISDDCSTDNTWQIITEYNDNRIVTVRHETNIGEYPNRNFCLQMATGKYIIYIDGDDKLNPEGLGSAVKEIEKYKDCGMLISRDYDEYRLFSSEECMRKHYLTNYSMLNLALVYDLINRDFFLRLGGFSTKYKSGDDYARLLMATHYSVLIQPSGLAWWRLSPNSASQKLFKSFSGVSEPFEIKFYFLKMQSYLSNSEVRMAHRKIFYKIYLVIRSLVKRGRIAWIFLLLYKVLKWRGRIV